MSKRGCYLQCLRLGTRFLLHATYWENVASILEEGTELKNVNLTWTLFCKRTHCLFMWICFASRQRKSSGIVPAKNPLSDISLLGAFCKQLQRVKTWRHEDRLPSRTAAKSLWDRRSFYNFILFHPFPFFVILFQFSLTSLSLYSDVPSNRIASLSQGRPFKDLLQGAEWNSQRCWLLCASICAPGSNWPVFLVLYTRHFPLIAIHQPASKVVFVIIDWCKSSDSEFGGNMLWIVYFSHPRSHVYTMRPPRWICQRDTCDANFGVRTSDLRRCKRQAART